MTIKQLKKQAKAKFGKITTFTSRIGLDHYEWTKLISAATKNMTPERQKEIDRLGALVRSTKVGATKEDLTPEIRQQIKEVIEEKFGGVVAFCLDNPSFTPNPVWHIIEGRRKRIGPTVKRLLKTLKIQ